jgi:hypothetical protein
VEVTSGNGEVHGGVKAEGGGAALLGSEVGDDGIRRLGGPKVHLGRTAAAINKAGMGGLTRSNSAKMNSGCQNYFFRILV